MSGQEGLNSSVQSMAVESGKGGSAGAGKGGSTEDGGATELFKVNQVYYRLPPTLSLVSKRTLLVNQFQRTTYPGPYNDVLSCVFNTGEYYVSMPSSYLYMEIGYNSPAAENIPSNANTTASASNNFNFAKAIISQGNAMSLIEEVVFLSASGTEVCREQNKGLESSVRFRYEHTQEYIDTIGQLQGAAYGPYHRNYDAIGPVFDASIGGNVNLDFRRCLPIGGWESLVKPRTGPGSRSYFNFGAHNINNSTPGVNTGTVLAPLATPTATVQKFTSVAIPMDQVLGLFKPYMSTLFPAGALAGGRLEIRLKNPIEALQFIAGAVEMNAESKANGTQTFAGARNSGSQYLDNLIKANQSGLTINKIYLVLDSFQLQDNVLKRLNAISAGQDGLSVLFDTYDHTSVIANGSSVEAQVQQARSRIVRSYCVVRDSANLNNPYINSLCSEAAATRITQTCGSNYNNRDVPSNTAANGGALISAATDSKLANISSQSGIENGWNPLIWVSSAIGGPGSNSGVGSTSNQASSLSYNPLAVIGTGGSAATTVTGLAGTYYPFQDRPAFPNSPFTTASPVVSSYQCQLGALFFPQQPLTTVGEFYQNALYTWCKSVPDKADNCSVTVDDFVGGLGWCLYDPSFPPVRPTAGGGFSIVPGPIGSSSAGAGTTGFVANTPGNNPTKNDFYGFWIAPYGCAIYGMLAEKSQALQLSGLPISNARLLRHKFNFSNNWPNPMSQGSRTINVFTQYTRVMKVFLGGRIVVRE